MDKKLSVKIVVATHKKYKMPNDDMYIPLHVGAEGKRISRETRWIWDIRKTTQEKTYQN